MHAQSASVTQLALDVFCQMSHTEDEPPGPLRAEQLDLEFQERAGTMGARPLGRSASTVRRRVPSPPASMTTGRSAGKAVMALGQAALGRAGLATTSWRRAPQWTAPVPGTQVLNSTSWRCERR